MSFAEGLMLFPGVIIRPRATFQKLRDAERGYWWLVLVVALALTIVYSLIAQPYTQEMARRQVDAQFEELYGDLNDLSDMEQQIYNQQVAMLDSPFLFVVQLIAPIFLIPLGYLIMAAVLHLASAVLGGRAEFRQTFRMAVWTTVPSLIRTLIGILVVAISGRLMAPGMTAGLGPNGATEQTVLYAFLSGIDIFALWSLVLIAIGVAQTAQISAGKSVIVTAVWWVISLVPVGMTWIGQALTSSMTGMAGT